MANTTVAQITDALGRAFNGLFASNGTINVPSALRGVNMATQHGDPVADLSVSVSPTSGMGQMFGISTDVPSPSDGSGTVVSMFRATVQKLYGLQSAVGAVADAAGADDGTGTFASKLRALVIKAAANAAVLGANSDGADFNGDAATSASAKIRGILVFVKGIYDRVPATLPSAVSAIGAITDAADFNGDATTVSAKLRGMLVLVKYIYVNFPTLGAKNSAGSMSVVLASDYAFPVVPIRAQQSASGSSPIYGLAPNTMGTVTRANQTGRKFMITNLGGPGGVATGRLWIGCGSPALNLASLPAQGAITFLDYKEAWEETAYTGPLTIGVTGTTLDTFYSVWEVA